MDIKLTDGGTPPLISDQTGRVNVRVTRNANVPEFQGEQPFEASVTEKQAPNTKIFQVIARDADPEVSQFACRALFFGFLESLESQNVTSPDYEMSWTNHFRTFLAI